MLLERIMYVDAATPVNCVFTVKIRGNINPENLYAALHKIQQRHPLLRVRIDEASKDGPFFVLNENIGEIPVRVSERITDNDWLKESQAECHKIFDGENEPFARLVWLRSSAVSELILVLPHCVCDGSSMVMIMRELLRLLDDPHQQLEAYETLNSVQELMPDTFNAEKYVWKSRIFSLLVKLLHLFFLFYNPQNKCNTGNDYVLHWKLDEEQTLAISRACKNAGTSVHAALCAAFIKAFQQIRGNKARGKIFCPVDIRLSMPQIKRDTIFAFAPMVALTIEKNSDTDIWDAARKIKTDLIAKINAMKTYEMLWMGEYLHASVNGMIKSLKTNDGKHDVTLSNMGRVNIPETYQTFELETIYSGMVAFPWRNPNTLVSSKFKKQFDFTFMSNDAFLDEAEALRIKNRAMELLLSIPIH